MWGFMNNCNDLAADTRIFDVSYKASACFAVVAVLAMVALLASASLLQPSYADDFVADAQCIEGHWYVTIHDAHPYNGNMSSGQEDALRDSGLLQGVSIRTITSAGSTEVKSSFETGKSGSFFLAPEYNTGWVWLSKPGYNDQKVRSSCDTAYDVFSYSRQFASYCYDYTYAAVPTKYLSDMTADHTPYEGSVGSIMSFFDEQITSRDAVIETQAREIKDLLGALGYGNATSNATGTTISLSNSTRDSVCLLHIKTATSTLYELLGALHVFRSGLFEGRDFTDSWALWSDGVYEKVLGLDALACDGGAGRAPEMAAKLADELETLQILAAETQRQIDAYKYELQAPQQQQSYYYYNNNYYSDDSYYDGNTHDYNSRNDFYYYDSTGSKPYDYGNHNTIENYDPEEHRDHDHVHSNCVTFCDSSEYEPDWARYLDKYEAREACWDVEANPDRIGTADWYWCKDLDKYLYRHHYRQ